jgi:DNA-binding transcriptional ArsR family regulator
VDDHLNITRPDQLQALGDPTRWRILGRLSESAATVQELARALGIAKGTAAHHVRVLNTTGLIRVAETKRIRGVVEKRYARVARQFRLDEGDRELLAKGAGDTDLTNLPLRQAVAEARPSDGSYPDDPSMSLVVRARMPVARAKRFARLVEALAEEFADGAPNEGETFGFVGAVYVPDWASSARERH